MTSPASMDERIEARDRAARARAVDPRYNVALEASAGTGKTRVLVDRYVNLLRAGVDPANILAITFTRKAAAEMRERIVATVKTAADRGEFAASRWLALRDRIGDIDISTIDAFCLSLLREFPLEADLDPGFSIADDTEVPRLIDESLDRALRACRGVARDDEHVALVFAQLGDRRARRGLAALLNRRVVAPSVLSRYLATGSRDLTVASAVGRGAEALAGVFASMRGGLERFLDTGPPEPAFLLLERSLRAVDSPDGSPDPAAVQVAFARAREHFLTQDGTPRTRLAFSKAQFASAVDFHAHRDLVTGHAPAIARAYAGYRRDLNVLVSRGVWRMFRIAETEYRRTLASRALVDFPDVLLRALDLLRQMEEFAQSRYRLESRYHHVLVDEFQDTSRAQWELISLLVQSWGEGAGLAHTGPLPPSIFIVGDRKQSIYGFRDADVSVLREASRHLEALRPAGDVRRSISRSFRSVPAILAFVNDLFGDVHKTPARKDGFQYTDEDRFPIPRRDPSDAREEPERPAGDAPLGIVAGATPEECAEATADEIARLVSSGATVRDRATGLHRPVRAADIGILFRTRESHREFEDALERRGIAAYVYKGLGFFDADEIKDVLALLAYLADPASDLCAAAFLRSRIVKMSDEGLRLLAPRLASALQSPGRPAAAARLDPEDAAALDAARAASARWRALADLVPPAELLDAALAECAYAVETRGPRLRQARENLKKVRALIRRIQNRGYTTLGRLVSHLDRLAVGDEANAVIDASDAVHLMTVHASKGLEFPVVFVVNLTRGTGNRRDPIRLAPDSDDEPVSVSVGDFLSDADEDEIEREREETKRLLYVALTRARDRLYLGAVLKDGRLQPGRGSLGDVMPPSLSAAFVEAGAGVEDVRWTASSGAVHTLRACVRLKPDTTYSTHGLPKPDITYSAHGLPKPDATYDMHSERHPPAPAAAPPGECDVAVGDFRPVRDDGIVRASVAAVAAGQPASPVESREGAASDRLVGIAVHRLVQRLGLDAARDEGLDRLAREMLRAGELAAPDPDAFVQEVRSRYLAFCAHADVRRVLGSGERLHEVPFTMIQDGAVVRGTIDCLVVRPDRGVTVLEFKTGRPRPEHAAQAELYRAAAQAIFPDAAVEAMVIYAAEVPT